MAAFDPSIISQISEGAPDPVAARAKGMQLKDMANTQQFNQLRLNELKSDQADEVKAKEILKGAKFDTQKGVYETMEKLSQAGLQKKALEFGSLAQKYKSGEIEEQVQQLQLAGQEHDVIATALDRARAPLDQLKEQGAPPAQIDAMAMKGALEERDRLVKLYPPDKYPGIANRINQFFSDPKNLTYAGIDAAERQSNKGQEMIKSRLAEFNAETSRRKEQETERKDSANEAMQNRRQDAADAKTKQSTVDDETMRKTAKAIASYRIRPPSLSRSGQSSKILAMVQEENPNYDATRFDERNRAVSAFGSGKQGDTVRSLNVGVQHLNVLDQLSSALDNGDTQAINKLRNVWREQTGSDLPTNFNAAKQVVGDEIVKAVQGAGTAGALGDREEIKKQLNAAESPKQLAGVIRTYKQLMGGQLKGLRKQYKDSTGLDNFNDKLEQETIEELDRAPDKESKSTLDVGASTQIGGFTVKRVK